MSKTEKALLCGAQKRGKSLCPAQAVGQRLRKKRQPAPLQALGFTLDEVQQARLAPIGFAMDGIQQLFTRPELPLANLRNWGMSGFERSGPLKAWVTRQAMGVNF